MKLMTTMLGLTMALGVAAVMAGDKPADKSPTTKPVNKFCAVDQDHEIDPNGKTYTYKDKVIGFCCDDCIEVFAKDPEKYMAKLK